MGEGAAFCGRLDKQVGLAGGGRKEEGRWREDGGRGEEGDRTAGRDEWVVVLSGSEREALA